MINKRKQLMKIVTGGKVKRTVAGGMLGASLGYMINPKKAKKVLNRINHLRG